MSPQYDNLKVFGCSCFLDLRDFDQPNSNLDQLISPSQFIASTTKVTNVWTPLEKLLYLGMSFLMNIHFPFQENLPVVILLLLFLRVLVYTSSYSHNSSKFQKSPTQTKCHTDLPFSTNPYPSCTSNPNANPSSTSIPITFIN